MSSLTLARFASATVMGAQVYEQAVDDRADAALRELAPQASLRRLTVRPLRARIPGSRRVPMSLLLNGSPRTRRQIARALYRNSGPVHRMKVGLPPSPHGDILTLHDASPWRYADESTPVRAAAEELRRADAIITVSRFSAEEIVHLFGTREPIVIPNGVDHDRFAGARPLDVEALAELGVTGRYVLASGGASQRKNLEGLAQAWPLIRSARPDLSLVMTGPEHPRRDALLGTLDGVVRVGRLPDEVLPRVLKASTALIIPSLYEGFGLPAVEGMAAGVPVVALDASSLPEVLGPAGILTDPTPTALADGVIWATSGDREVATRVELGRERSREFTWERSAAAHAEVWAKILAGG